MYTAALYVHCLGLVQLFTVHCCRRSVYFLYVEYDSGLGIRSAVFLSKQISAAVDHVTTAPDNDQRMFSPIDQIAKRIFCVCAPRKIRGTLFSFLSKIAGCGQGLKPGLGIRSSVFRAKR